MLLSFQTHGFVSPVRLPIFLPSHFHLKSENAADFVSADSIAGTTHHKLIFTSAFRVVEVKMLFYMLLHLTFIQIKKVPQSGHFCLLVHSLQPL